MAKAYANDIRDELLDLLRTDLPGKVEALGLPDIETWENARQELRTSALYPAVLVRFAGWSQPRDDEHWMAGGSTQQTDTVYEFTVQLACKHADPVALDEDLAAYAECLRACIDDADNYNVGGAADDMWPGDLDTSPAFPQSDSTRVRALELRVYIQKQRTVGNYAT